MADAGLAQDDAGQPPTATATDFASKDGWLAPMKFTGTSLEDAQLWWSSFQLYKYFKQLTDRRALAIFPLMLKDGTMTWYLGQPDATKTNWVALQDAVKERYFPQEMNRWKQISQVWSMKQKTGQLAIDFMEFVKIEAGPPVIEGDQFRCVIVQRLLPNTRKFVVTRDGKILIHYENG